jgi:fumarate hydratase subunit alpha
MKTITEAKIRDAVAGLCIRANLYLRKDVLSALKKAFGRETNKRAKRSMKAILDNAAVAKLEKIAICQDTGMPVVFVEIGREVKITGDLKSAINKGVASGYRRAYLRDSIIENPLSRGSAGGAPAIIHIDIAGGNTLKLTVLPKGFGCENKSALKMFKPTAKLAEIKDFIVGAVQNAGPDACPPYVVGVGIGGTADYAPLLAKKALLRKIGVRRQQSIVHRLEQQLFKEVNKLNIGPMGLGGKTTALAVHIETYPTHIAGLPVAVNLSCHALRSATLTL